MAAAHAGVAGPVLILGDSLSAGYGISREASWPHLLGEHMRREGYRQSVVNASISGETTAGGARRLGPLLEAHAPSVVVIALGANDGLRGFELAEIRRNLRALVERAGAGGAEVVLARVRIPPNYGPRYTEAFEGLYDEIAAAAEVVAAPFMLERFAADPAAFQRDGLHPTAAVQPAILDTLWPAIRTALEAAALETDSP